MVCFNSWRTTWPSLSETSNTRTPPLKICNPTRDLRCSTSTTNSQHLHFLKSRLLYYSLSWIYHWQGQCLQNQTLLPCTFHVQELSVLKLTSHLISTLRLQRPTWRLPFSTSNVEKYVWKVNYISIHLLK